jgi:hypothetical protein
MVGFMVFSERHTEKSAVTASAGSGDPHRAEVMMGNVNKTEKLDAEGLATLLHLGKLPTVWIPDATLRAPNKTPKIDNIGVWRNL